MATVFFDKNRLESCINRLLSEEAIPQDLAEDILAWEDINSINNQGVTALHYAAKNGLLNEFKELIELGAVINHDESVLASAVAAGKLEIIKYILENWSENDILHTNDKKQNALHIAAKEGQLESFELLYNNEHFQSHFLDQDVDGKIPFDLATVEFLQIMQERLASNQNDLDNLTFDDVSRPLTLDNIIEFLKLKNIITKDFATEILAKNDINTPNREGQTALHIVSEKGDLALVKALNQLGALNKGDKDNNTAFLLAASKGNTEIVKYFLEIWESDDILAINNDRQNALHVAIRSNQLEVAMLLLSDERFLPHLQDRDFYRQTPFLLAVRQKADELIRKISKDPELVVQRLSNYGKPLLDLSQSVLNEKLSAYLKLKKRDDRELIDNRGNCNGWALLYQIYLTMKKENEFFNLLTEIASWDGLENSLIENNITHTLHKNYKNKEEIFDQIINALAILQFSSPATSDLQLAGWHQAGRAEQYELIKDVSSERQLKTEFSYEFTGVSETQLKEILDIFSLNYGASIDITCNNHVVTCYITNDGKFKYYDSNFKNQIDEINNSTQLANMMLNQSFKKEDFLSKDSMDIRFVGYRFYNQRSNDLDSKNLAKNRFKLSKNSENGFNSLHYAVMTNNTNEIARIMRRNSQLMFQADNHGITPLRMAICQQMEYILSCISKSEYFSGYLNFREIANLEPTFIRKLFTDGWLKPSDIDANRNTFLNCAIGYQDPEIAKAILAQEDWVPNVHDFKDALFYHANDEVLQIMMMKDVAWFKDLNDQEKTRSLIVAVKYKNASNVLQLINLGADPTIKDGKGASASDYAMNDAEILALLNQRERSKEIKKHQTNRKSLVFAAKIPMESLPTKKDSASPTTVESSKKPRN
ncbi:ankyrin repeat domain-containing protein [Candidatus Berkiella cookevillensis]|uniref:Ankyrin repeat domain-containing protein n=1 Tax=Candidatus Berkiella cookevillensis TaxID=437022 RepID=A0A0Q9YQY9_9GAMM|nr:ankyrin repeat domain-containing protein [Candidatus Berkiella cookevillensis]MCS5708308.1 ankyrin repeat domain-containing protein [Candidatus Berkiella cookevillensis]